MWRRRLYTDDPRDDFINNLGLIDDSNTDFIKGFITSVDESIEDYSNKEFLKDVITDQTKHWLVRIFDVFLYAGMVFIDWLEKKLTKK